MDLLTTQGIESFGLASIIPHIRIIYLERSLPPPLLNGLQNQKVVMTKMDRQNKIKIQSPSPPKDTLKTCLVCRCTYPISCMN
jgi:hypothetical protein